MTFPKSIPPNIYQRLQCPYREGTVPSKINLKKNRKHKVKKPIASGIPPSVQKRLQNYNSTNNKYPRKKNAAIENPAVMQALSQYLSNQNRARLSRASKQYRTLDKNNLELRKKVHEIRNKKGQINKEIIDHILKLTRANVQNFNSIYNNLNFPMNVANFNTRMAGIKLNENVLSRTNSNTQNTLYNPILFHIINKKTLNPSTKKRTHFFTGKESKILSFENVVNMLEDKRRRNMAGNTPLLYILKLLVNNNMNMCHKKILEQYINVLFEKNKINALNNVNIFGKKTMNLVKQLDESDMILRRIKKKLTKLNKEYNNELYKKELKK